MRAALATSVVAMTLLLSSCFPSSYGSCDEAREDGAAPLTESDDGWNPSLDRDGDGIACELD